jgi:hypothetical protein
MRTVSGRSKMTDSEGVMAKSWIMIGAIAVVPLTLLVKAQQLSKLEDGLTAGPRPWKGSSETVTVVCWNSVIIAVAVKRGASVTAPRASGGLRKHS